MSDIKGVFGNRDAVDQAFWFGLAQIAEAGVPLDMWEYNEKTQLSYLKGVIGQKDDGTWRNCYFPCEKFAQDIRKIMVNLGMDASVVKYKDSWMVVAIAEESCGS